MDTGVFYCYYSAHGAMKVLLVEPLKVIWEMMRPCVPPPLGLAQLAAVLEENNIDVKILDCTALNIGPDALAQAIWEEQPDVVGATALTPFFYHAVEIAQIAKQVDSRIVTVLGGPHVTYLPEETLKQNPAIDIVARGEGERTLVDLVHCLEHGNQLSQVKGIGFRSNGEVVLTESQPLVDVNELPLPAYHLLPMEKYYFPILGRFATVLASRGCPHQCTFCSEWRFWGGRWRKRDPKKIGDELELLVRKYNMESIWFGDDCFNVSGELIQGICDEIKARHLDFSWFYQGRADLLVEHRDLLPLMKETGNRMVQIGVEASTQQELEELNKKLALDKVAQAVELLRKYAIVSQGLMIVGTRTDSAESIMHKVRYMQSLDVDFPVFTMFTPFPGSDIYEQAKANNWLETQDYSLYDMANPAMSTQHLTRKQLTASFRWCYSAYYANPFRLVRGLVSRNDWKRRVWWHMFKFTLKQIARSLTRF
ncbi:MAG: radical SAM protein [Dehalococcoidia bacterium]|nr:MAG: radical SAM protein [Dehalococcoidia bacterium]